MYGRKRRRWHSLNVHHWRIQATRFLFLGLARAHRNLVVLGALPPRDMVPHAKAALRKALELDPEFAEAHSLLASLAARHEWNWAEADRHHRLALRLAPNTAEVHDEYAPRTWRLRAGSRKHWLRTASRGNSIRPHRNCFAARVLILLLARRLGDTEREAKADSLRTAERCVYPAACCAAPHGESGRRSPRRDERTLTAMTRASKNMKKLMSARANGALSRRLSPAPRLLSRLSCDPPRASLSGHYFAGSTCTCATSRRRSRPSNRRDQKNRTNCRCQNRLRVRRFPRTPALPGSGPETRIGLTYRYRKIHGW